MTTAHYIAKVQDTGLLELPGEASELGLKPGDRVKITVQTSMNHRTRNETSVRRTPEERAKAYRTWADNHSTDTPLLSDEAISRESLYGDRG